MKTYRRKELDVQAIKVCKENKDAITMLLEEAQINDWSYDNQEQAFNIRDKEGKELYIEKGAMIVLEGMMVGRYDVEAFKELFEEVGE